MWSLLGGVSSAVTLLCLCSLVEYSLEQGNRNLVQPFRGPLLRARDQGESFQQQQQVILPRGYQEEQQPIQRNYPSLGSYETRGNSRVIPSIQNGHFHLRSRGSTGPFLNERQIGGFSPVLTAAAAQPPPQTSAVGQAAGANDGRYEYYDDNDDIIYHYSNEDGPPDSSANEGSSSAASSSASSSKGASGGSAQVLSKLIGSGKVGGRRVPGSGSSGLSQPSSLISLVEDQGANLSLRGRSVQSQQSQRNSASHHPNPTPLPGLIRNPAIYAKNPTTTTTPPPPPAPITKRPGILRGPVNRFTLSSRPPLPSRASVDASVASRNEASRAVASSATLTDATHNRVSSNVKDSPEEVEYEYHEEDSYYDDDDLDGEEIKVKEPETKTKVTVSVSTKTSSTTPRPAPSSSTQGPGIVISVATTRSVSDRVPSPSTTPPPLTTPKVTFSRATGSSIVVASVQTSRSVATPVNPSQRLISSQHPPLVATKSEPEYYEEEYTYPDNYPVVGNKSLADGQPTPSTAGDALSPESVMDKLDSLQSELANGVLNGLHSQTSSSTTLPLLPSVTPATTTSTTTGASITAPRQVAQEPAQSLNVESLFKAIKFKEAVDLSHLLPPGYVPPTTAPQTTTTSATTTTSSTTVATTTPAAATPESAGGIFFQTANIASLLPKGYRLPTGNAKSEVAPPAPLTTTEAPSTSSVAITTSTTETASKPPRAVGLESLLSKVKFSDISALLPPGYDESRFASSTSAPGPSTTTSTEKIPESTGIEAIVPNIKFDDISKFLPPGFSPSGSTTPAPQTTPTQPSSSTKLSLNKLVFPTRPGGLKATRPTTTDRTVPDTPPPLRVTIMKGPPTRKTTEFTGWPTSSTTPMPSTSSTTTTTEATTTTTTTTTPKSTTTPIPPKRSRISTCGGVLCKMEAVLRIVGHRWKPEYTDINTDEWKHLERTVKRELDAAYRSSGLAQYYRSVEIEGFTRGSVIVDYFVLLENVTTNLTSADVRALFHASLPPSDVQDDGETVDGDNKLLPADERLRLGRYTIDPKYTDFKVRNVTTETLGPAASEGIIPQWGIAVIVIGLVSLLFVVIFGVTVLVNKHKNAKKKNTVSLTQEMLSEFNKTHSHNYGVGVDNYGADDLYNMDDVWNDKQPQMDRTFDRKPKRGSSSGKGSVNYNIYDSWKTEWNGHYYNGNYYGDSGYAPSRRRSDYDTNF